MESIGEEPCRADALTGLAPYLPEHLRPEAVRLAEALAGDLWRSTALSALELAPPASGPAANGPAVSWPGAAGPPASDLVAGLVCARVIEREFERVQALAELAPYPSQLAPEQLGPAWQERLHLLAARQRRDLLADLQVTQPVTVALGQARAVAEVAGAVRDVGRWWP